jgi:hypothetical protein
MEFQVQFIGYAAYIVTEKESMHAKLDFVTGGTYLHVRDGYIGVPNRRELASFAASLPMHLDAMNDKLKRNRARDRGGNIEWSFGKNEICLPIRADAGKCVRRFEMFRREVEPVLEQAEIIGLQLKRGPYSEYIDEIEKTRIARVVLYGVGVFNNGQLDFHRLNKTALVEFSDCEPIPPGSREFRIGSDINSAARARSLYRAQS